MLWNWSRIFEARVESIRSLARKLVERRQGDRAVAEDLDVETAGAEGDDRPENRVAEDADHQFAAIRACRKGSIETPLILAFG